MAEPRVVHQWASARTEAQCRLVDNGVERVPTYEVYPGQRFVYDWHAVKPQPPGAVLDELVRLASEVARLQSLLREALAMIEGADTERFVWSDGDREDCAVLALEIEDALRPTEVKP